jgi:hypothetical protein
MNAAQVLQQLARELCDQGCYIQAAKCLYSVCVLPNELPTTTAAARLRLAHLLLDHFDNVEAAKKQLRNAVGVW